MYISSSVREFFSTGTAKLAPHLMRYRNRAQNMYTDGAAFFPGVLGKKWLLLSSTETTLVSLSQNTRHKMST